jgi:exopolysaccharide biosynthesis protein
MSVLGIKSNGNVIMLTNDGRQSGYSDGITISKLDDLCADLDIVTCILLDGGGSASMVQLLNGSYTLVNRPSDKFADGTYGSPRSVVNTVILSYGPKK